MIEFWAGGALVAAVVGISLHREGHLTINSILLGVLYWPLFWLIFVFIIIFRRKP